MSFLLLLSVGLIEIITANEIELSQRNHKRMLVDDILHSVHYDELVSVQLKTQLPIKLTPAVSLLSVEAAMDNQERISILLEVATVKGYNGLIRLLVAVSPDGTVQGVRITEHHETPGLGDKIQSNKSGWIHAFNGRSLGNLSKTGWHVRRDGGEFDQFTGATITPRAVINAIYETLAYVHSHSESLL